MNNICKIQIAWDGKNQNINCVIDGQKVTVPIDTLNRQQVILEWVDNTIQIDKN